MSLVKGSMNTKDAAELIGVTDRTLRLWIKNFYARCPGGRGKPGRNECKAEKIEDTMFAAGYVYQVPESEVERLKQEPQTGGGRPRLGKAG